MKWTRVITSAIVLAVLMTAAAKLSAQPSTINFNVPGPADWNTANNWIVPNVPTPFVPGDGFDVEIVGISNGGIAELTSPALFDVLGVVIGETHDPSIPNPTEEFGTLNISAAGQLRLVDPIASGGAALRVGDAGRGVLNISGGSASADTLTVAGAADSALNLSGSAVVGITGNASLGRITRIEGAGVTLDVEGDLIVRGTFLPVITGTAHSPITVSSGRADVGGTLRPMFAGHTPGIGESWTLIDAERVSGAFTVDSSQTPQLPRGAIFDVTYNVGGSGDVVLTLDNRLILSINRVSGAATIENAVGAAISMDGYTIGSPGGVLDPGDGGWMSLDDANMGAWTEANPTSQNISELNPLGSLALEAGQNIGIGSPYAFTPTAIGQRDENLTFAYKTTDHDIKTGIVEFVGNHNNLVLVVDPATGDAVIENQSQFTVEIDGYTISSPSGSLLSRDGDWFSFADAGVGDWREANPTANNLSELNPLGGSVFSPGAFVPFGSPFDVTGERDLTILFSLVDGDLLSGVVQYGVLPAPGLPGDTNRDGMINVDDLNAVRNNFGAGDGSDHTGIPGDAFPFDGFVNIDDLNAVRNNFGAMAGDAGAVPEPTSWILLGIAFCVVGWNRIWR